MAGMNNLILDTNIILYAAVYGDEIALELLQENNIFISDITEIELLGYHRLNIDEYDILKKLLESINIIAINNRIKYKAIALRRKYALKTPDAIIASTAIHHDFFLVTADKKLHKIKDINIIQFDAP
jgi:predicted nucleic acid-binding protein